MAYNHKFQNQKTEITLQNKDKKVTMNYRKRSVSCWPNTCGQASKCYQDCPQIPGVLCSLWRRYVPLQCAKYAHRHAPRIASPEDVGVIFCYSCTTTYLITHNNVEIYITGRWCSDIRNMLLSANQRIRVMSRAKHLIINGLAVGTVTIKYHVI